jgi:DNA-directed RNA polymerase specialized sigma24 family protein
MDDPRPGELVCRARRGDVAAFEELVRRHQAVAFGCALALLRDRDLAEDVLQESFVAAYHGLGRLGDPESFPAWLRGIVRHHCHRVLRRPRVVAVPLEQAGAVAAGDGRPELEAEQGETRARGRARRDLRNGQGGRQHTPATPPPRPSSPPPLSSRADAETRR